jgi:Zn finger protein HypA/HybF involved in hydrogenase expression
MSVLEPDMEVPPGDGCYLWCKRCGFELPLNTFGISLCPDCGMSLEFVTWRKGEESKASRLLRGMVRERNK